MENEYREYDPQQTEAEEEVKAVPEKKVSPFADSPYEMAYQPQEVPSKSAKPQKAKKGKKILCAVLVIALLVVACNVTAICVSSGWNAKFKNYTQAMENKLAVLQEKVEAQQGSNGDNGNIAVPEGAMTPGTVYTQNVKAVVAISNQALTTNIYGQISETASSGSGFIISQDGYVVSNFHVVQGATSLRVITSDAKEYEAKLVGYDAANDISVLKIDATGLPYVKLGSSDALTVGDQVAAIGNPLGELTSTLTVGYISAKDRLINTDGTYINMLQTDAAINSGNSGGPLFNMNGEVVGITTAKYSGTSTSGASIEGIGFAIPMDDVRDMIEDLITHGYITGAYLGVMVRDMDSEVAQMYGLPSGVYVEEVMKGSCAEAAGVRAKDIIVNIGGHDTENMSVLTRVLRKFSAGETTTITVYRGGTQEYLEITLDEKPVSKPSDTVIPETTQPENDAFDDWFGGIFPDFGG